MKAKVDLLENINKLDKAQPRLIETKRIQITNQNQRRNICKMTDIKSHKILRRNFNKRYQNFLSKNCENNT
jgi:hypothetical protein